jgi:hypothetical protein
MLLFVPVLGRATASASEPIPKMFDVGVSQIVYDVLEISSQGYRAPGATRTMFRVLVLLAGAMGLARYRASDDFRYGPLATLVGVCIGVAYLGKYAPAYWPVDPYFFAILGTFAATVPASALLVGIPWRRSFEARVPRVLSLVVLFVAVPRLVRTAATFIPEILPNRVVRATVEWMISPMAGVKEPLPDRLRHEPAPPTFAIASNWLVAHHGGRGNVLVDDPALSAYLALTTSLPVIGPLGERGARSTDADPYWIFDEPEASHERVAAFLERYAVGWIALWGAPGRFDFDDPLVDPLVRVAGVRLRRVRRDPSFFVEGRGSIAGVALGRISVHAEPADEVLGAPTRQGRVTLRFHHDRRLACRPDCRVVSGSTEWITVEHPPEEFDLVCP